MKIDFAAATVLTAAISMMNPSVQSRSLEDKVDRLSRALAKTHDDLTIKKKELRILQTLLEASQSWHSHGADEHSFACHTVK